MTTNGTLKHCPLVEQYKAFIEKGNILLDFMIHNFKDMIDGENNLKHFHICQGLYGLSQYIDMISDIQCLQLDLISWIKHEYMNGMLFQNKNWKPFRDPDLILCMFLGYRRLFVYKQYYFQLAILDSCECDDCKYCKIHKKYIHFSLALYGWKKECDEKLLPDKLLNILPDNLIPEWFWNLE